MISKSHRWQKTAMAIAAAALFSLWGSNATALSLGRISVQSALGEPLRAEIEVPEINAEEAASLKPSIALPEAFRAAGLEYNPAMAAMQVTLQRRADGRAYLRLSSDRAINDPFVDMILVANWATGRIVRDYTLLFDPPSLRKAPATAPTPAQVPAQIPAPSSASRTASAAPASSRPIAGPAVEPGQSPVKPITRPAVVKTQDTEAHSVTVNPGDTAGKIATATKPANVSLDQMLVALLRANPAAFIGDNVNRVKAGSVVNIPTAAQAEATPAADARQIIIAQSKDFNDFRRKLAGAAPSAQVASADRTASGTVQAKVEEKKPLAAVPDKLTLSKGAIQGTSAEAQLAKERNVKEAADRATEIAKNISDLGKLGAASSVVAPALSASAASPAAPDAASNAAAVTASAQAGSAAVSANAVVPSPGVGAAASAPTPAASVAKKVPAITPASVPEPGPLDDLTDSPLALSGALGLIALLVAFGLYRRRQHKKVASGDSSFLDSRLQPDSFFGASGGESVDTSDNAATGSSMVYSPSQLDAVDDVDPVAEADVYLAYGRDLQAEEILKDALVSNPARLAIHQKLLEIFAKRRDANNFEKMATQTFQITKGEGSDWERICQLGLSIDPNNALYQPGGQPNNLDGTPSRPMPLDQTGNLAGGTDAPATQVVTPQVGGAVDLDLDLDFSLDEEPVSAISETKASYPEPTISLQAADAPPALDLNFDLIEATAPFAAPETAAKADAANGPDAFEFSLPDLDTADNDQGQPAANSEDFKLQAANSFGLTGPVPLPDSAPPAPPAPDLGMLEFDLGSLSLDLGDEPPTETSATPNAHGYEDPLVTKLALAEEFRAIGDEDGARALIEEVISEASGDMKIKAQRALSNL
ncbi:peptidoglycan-binding LysM [Rhodoferax ferrireducens T118]|uniref:Peptidoglycan-binding LysM n=1 Tax=Albidiferax ferrireducens (strain ATCC BAA-621 / DSM 15236 / T118) TaxID=338969 RepID=Q21XI3_ALBFT|nr:peptidoglycan-binding LysM [Rhodoferax ferrireducens T118]